MNAVDSADADHVTGKSMCAKMLIKTVRRRDVSGPRASFELSGLVLCDVAVHLPTCQCQGQGDLNVTMKLQLAAPPLDK